MSITVESMEKWLRTLLKADLDTPRMSLKQYLGAIPRLESLADLPGGTPVLIRGDVDAKPGPKVGEGDIRLRSMKETLDYGRQKGWVQIVFGHIGRKPEGSLERVRNRLAEILGCDVGFIKDWIDPETNAILDVVPQTIQAASPGSVILLENTRKYDIERVLWKARADDVAKLIEPLTRLANEYAEKVAKVYVHEAFSAGSLDSSSVVAPAAMDRVALGQYAAGQFTGPLTTCLDAQMVVFSGLKIDKLDDLEAMIDRGRIRWVIAAGSLAMALKKATAEVDGKGFDMGVAEDPDHADKPYYIPRERIAQARTMIADGRAKGIRFVMPVDFVLKDGRVAETIGPGEQQLDVGPATRKLFEEQVGQFLEEHKDDAASTVVFHNGVFGMFEDPRFEEGTRQFVGQLKRMTEAGVKVYVGGGEGGKALAAYGQPDWVAHNFTAGGTVLNALGSEPVPYLVALQMAAQS
ncbi:MAG: phosphoglycerate kinase [Planctomycetota bacterium]|jgi:phosphoglycerate kinase